MKLLIATNHINKKREIDEILGPLGFETVIPKELGVAFDPEETGNTFDLALDGTGFFGVAVTVTAVIQMFV